jgi:uncharacterized protein YkwD
MRRSKARKLATACTLVFSLVEASCAAPPSSNITPQIPKSNSNPQPANSSHLAQDLLMAHNAKRATAGLGPLSLNPILETSAVEQALDMAERRKMSHRGNDGSSPFDRIKRNGYSFVAAAENVAYGFDDVESVMTGWMKSPGHKRNILGNFSEIGVGRAIARDGASYWCVTFGTPSGR